MAVTFTGTKTRDTYVSGNVYANGNGAYRANLDGSFTRLSNGGVLAGSSQSAKAVWGTTSGQYLGTGQSGREAAVSHVLGGGAAVSRATSGAGPGSGPGNPGALSAPGANALTVGAGVRAVATAENRGAFLLAGGKGQLEISPIRYMGVDFVHSLDTTDGQKWGDRYGEFGEWVGGVAVMGADAVTWAQQASTIKGDKVSADLHAAGWAIAEGFVADRQRVRSEAAAKDYSRHQRERQENTGWPGVPYSRANPDPYIGPTVWQPLTRGADGYNYRTGGGF